MALRRAVLDLWRRTLDHGRSADVLRVSNSRSESAASMPSLDSHSLVQTLPPVRYARKNGADRGAAIIGRRTPVHVNPCALPLAIV